MNGKLFNGDIQTNIQVLGALVNVVLVPLLGFLIYAALDHDRRLTRMESTLFTIHDGAALLREIQAVEELAKSLPPEEWRRRVRHIEQHLARTDKYKSP